MSKDWLERLEGHLPSAVEHAVKDADKAIHDLALHVHLSHWHPISTAPYNQELELRISESGEPGTLGFPCLRTNEEAWINVDLGTEIKIEPVAWRVWQHGISPEPHHSKIKPGDRSSLFRHAPPEGTKDNE